MSNRALTWAFDTPLPTVRKFVLVALADLADEAHSCFPGQDRIAGMVGCDVTTARRAIKALEEDGYLSRSRRNRGDGARTSDRYVLAVGFVPGDAPGTGEPTGRCASTYRALSPSLPGAVPEYPPENPQIPPSTSTKSRAIDPEGFAEFWSAYPRKVGKGQARTAFKAVVKRATVDEIVAGARRFASDPNLPEARFIPHPATWLRGERWGDDPLPAREDSSAPIRGYDATGWLQ